MNREQFLSYFFVGLFLFVCLQVILILSSFFQAIFWSCVLAFAFFPFYKRILKLTGGNATLSALCMTLLLIAAFLPILLVLIFNLVRETLDLYHLVLEQSGAMRIEQFIDRIRAIGFIHRMELRLGHLEFVQKNLQPWLIDASLKLGQWVAQQAGSIAKHVVIVTVNIFLTFFLIFFFFRDGEKIYQFIYKITPLDKKSKEHMFEKMNETFSAVIRGQLLTSLAQATLAGIIFWALGVRLPIFLALATFIASLIPIIGTACIWVPITLYLFAEGYTTKAAVLFLLGFFGISLVDNILKPVIIGEKTKLPYFLLFLAILGGVKVYGVVGAFLAPMVLSAFFALVQIYREKYL